MMKMKKYIMVSIAMCLVFTAFGGMTANAMPNHIVAGGILGPGGDISPGPANPANAADMVFYSTNEPSYTLIVGPDSFTPADGTDPALFARDVGNIWDWADGDEMVTVFETRQGVGGWTGVNHTTSLSTTLLLGSPVQDIGDSTLEPFPVITMMQGSDWVLLTWSPMIDAGNNLQSYPIYTAPTTAGPFVALGTVPDAPGPRSYNDTGLSMGPVCYQLSVNYRRDNSGGLYNTTGRSETVCTVITGTMPTVMSTSPVDNAINVPMADPIEVTFSEAMDTVTVSCVPSPVITLTPAWTVGDTVLTLSHVMPFAASTLYTVTCTGKDLDGNDIVAGPVPNPWSFTTVGIAPPEITNTAPPDGAIDVPLGQDIVVTFSEAMNTITVSCVPSPVITLTPSWTVGDTVLTLSHVTPFAASTLYTVTCTGQDVDGNNLVPGLVPNPWSFTTAGIVPPEITNTDPSDGAIAVLLNQDIVVTFSEAMNTVTVSCTPSPVITLTPAWTVGDTVLTLSHGTQFAASTLYTVTCTGQDVDGNSLVAGPVPNPWDFMTVTVPNNPPTATIDQADTLIGFCCSGGSDLTIPWIMDDIETPLDQLIVWLNYTAGATTDAIAGPLTGRTSPDSYVWTTPTLDENVTIWLEVIDGAGDSAQDFSASVMIDSTAPSVQSVVPSEGQTDVPTDSDVVVTFSEPMQKPTVVISFTPSVLNVQLAWDATNTTATVTHALFQVSTLYTLTVDATAKDDCTPGTEMGTANTTTFTTGAGPKLPGPPTNLAVSTVTYKSVVLTWSAPTQYTDGSTLPASDIDMYRVYRAESSTGVKVSIGEPTATTFTDNDVEEEKTYYYWVTTVNATDIESDYSNEASTTVPKQTTQDQFSWIWILIIVIVILLVVGIILLLRRKKPEEAPPEEVMEEEPVEEPAPMEEEAPIEEVPPEEPVEEPAPMEEEAPIEEAPAEEAPAEEATAGPITCANCGTVNPEGISLCTSCGSPL
jgi:hypothetical protein